LNKLSSSFDNGQKAEFFVVWDKLVPQKIKDTNYDCKKLEFNLHIYFVVYVMHPYNKNRMQLPTNVLEKELKREQSEFK
jgi:LisH domain-containing protein ARMC9